MADNRFEVKPTNTFVAECKEEGCGWVSNPVTDKNELASQMEYHREMAHPDSEE